MKRLIFLIVAVAVLIFLVLAGCGQKEEEQPATTTEEQVVEEVVAVDYTPTAEDVGTEFTCPVCGMTATVAENTPAAMYEETTYFFCTAEEKAQFMADAKSFLVEEEAEEVTEPAEAGEGE